MYPEVKLYIDGEWVAGSEGKSEPILDPATAQPVGKVPHASRADLDRALAAAEGLQGLAQDVGARPLQADAQGRRDHPLPRRRDRRDHDDGAGQAARRSQGRDAAGRRHHRLVRRRSRRTYGRVIPARAGTCISSSSRSRSAPSPRSRRGISRSTRRCARSRPRSPPAAR